MGGKKKYINIFGSFTEPFNSVWLSVCLSACPLMVLCLHKSTHHQSCWTWVTRWDLPTVHSQQKQCTARESAWGLPSLSLSIKCSCIPWGWSPNHSSALWREYLQNSGQFLHSTSSAGLASVSASTGTIYDLWLNYTLSKTTLTGLYTELRPAQFASAEESHGHAATRTQNTTLVYMTLIHRPSNNTNDNLMSME